VCPFFVSLPCAGFSLATAYYVWEESIMELFTHDPHTKEQLRGVWPFLVAVQPLKFIVSHSMPPRCLNLIMPACQQPKAHRLVSTPS